MYPFHLSGFYVDYNQTIYIPDRMNYSVVKWDHKAGTSQIVAGGNGRGTRTDQLLYPLDVTIDKMNDSIIICDRGNARVMQWPLQNGKSGQIIISKIFCYGLTMDNEGYLYIANSEKDEVRRWKIGNNQETIVAGGNRRGDRTTQLNTPSFIFVDHDHSVYVTDDYNYRVMKWIVDAKEGIIVASDQDRYDSTKELFIPTGIAVDPFGTVYVADKNNCRVMRWIIGATKGSVIVGENGCGNASNQLNIVGDISFDEYANLYVVDEGNGRVQQFLIDSY